ncbi:hypothetical protein CRUP_025009 [Coryphaenoides rupestris]|nr:hypothetical protein CRUP_025009 [Coryphaenoides rupestris]
MKNECRRKRSLSSRLEGGWSVEMWVMSWVLGLGHLLKLVRRFRFLVSTNTQVPEGLADISLGETQGYAFVLQLFSKLLQFFSGQPPLEEPLLRAEAGFWGGGGPAGPGTTWLEVSLVKNALAGAPVLGGEGDREDGGDAEEEVDGLWRAGCGVMWARPGQKDGFQAGG